MVKTSTCWKDRVLDEFKAFLGLTASPLTAQAYVYDVAFFFGHEATNGLSRVSMLKGSVVTKFLVHMKKQGRSSATLNRYYMALRKLSSFMVKVKFVKVNFMEDVVGPLVMNKSPRVMTQIEIERLMSSPNLECYYGWRDRAILEVLYSSGLRASELCNLCIRDVSETELTVRGGKGNKTRTVPITKTAYDFMSRHLTENRPGDERVFLNMNGRPLSRVTLRSIMWLHAKNAGIKGVSTHTLRHSCATHLLDEGADIRFIQELLGHGNIRTTQRYTHLSSIQIKSMFQKFHPREKRIV